MTRILVLPAVLLLCTAAWADSTVQDFEKDGEGTPFVLSKAGADPAPVVKDKQLVLTNGGRSRGKLTNSVAFARTAQGYHRKLVASFEFLLLKGAHGGGFALLDTTHYGTEGKAPEVKAWEEPNIPGAFAVGLDTFNPPTSHWFDAHGNVHDQPQREISLHWDGREIANDLCPVEFRDGKSHRLHLTLEFKNGGAEATLRIDDAVLYDRRFLPEVSPFESRVAIGGRTGETQTTFIIDDLKVDWEQPAAKVDIAKEPLRVQTFKAETLHGGKNTSIKPFELPPAGHDTERILLRLTLEPGPGGWDHWDRRAAVFAYRGKGEERETYEILRFMTPFRREYTWVADITEYQSLLRGKTELGVYISTVTKKSEDPAKQEGFNASVRLDYYPGRPAREAFRVLNLWQERYRFGNTREAIAAVFEDREVAIPTGTVAARLRFLVTGHGGFGEFTPHDRTVTVNGREFENRLWTTDVYLNPCRPQSGTWKFNRTGWAPGALVRPWDLDVSSLIEPGRPVVLGYRPHVYPDKPAKIAADHWVDSQLILYRDRKE